MERTVSDLDELKKIVFARFRDGLEKAAEEIAYEIETHFETFVDKWYAAGPVKTPGNPVVYDRWLDTFYASSGYEDFSSTHEVVEFDDGFELHAGITVGPGTMHGYYKDPLAWVFGRTWRKGIHGTIDRGGQTEPPKQMMDAWFKPFKHQGVRPILDKYLKD